jgi:hypothetical protein
MADEKSLNLVEEATYLAGAAVTNPPDSSTSKYYFEAAKTYALISIAQSLSELSTFEQLKRQEQ